MLWPICCKFYKSVDDLKETRIGLRWWTYCVHFGERLMGMYKHQFKDNDEEGE